MKPINTYITEGIFKNIGAERVKPKTKKQLVSIIIDTIMKDGPECDLNFIDTSLITDMSYLFTNKYNKYGLLNGFNGDISQWNTSKVKDMSCMFYNSKFNGDISEWDTSRVTNMKYIFSVSQFNGDISKWDVSKVECMNSMFENSMFNGDISKWDVSKVKDMQYMFSHSVFAGDISKWNVSNATRMNSMFKDSIFNGDISKWDVSNVTETVGMFENSIFNRDISGWKINVPVPEDVIAMFKHSKIDEKHMPTSICNDPELLDSALS